MPSESKIPNPPEHPYASLIVKKIEEWRNKDNQIVGAILHLHLCCEEVITNACQHRLKKPKALFPKDNQVKFATKLKIMEALYAEEINSSVYTFLQKLNKLRNSSAHVDKKISILDKLNEMANSDIWYAKNARMPSKNPAYAKGDEKIAIEVLTYQTHAALMGIFNAMFDQDVKNYDEAMIDWINNHLN